MTTECFLFQRLPEVQTVKLVLIGSSFEISGACICAFPLLNRRAFGEVTLQTFYTDKQTTARVEGGKGKIVGFAEQRPMSRQERIL